MRLSRIWVGPESCAWCPSSNRRLGNRCNTEGRQRHESRGRGWRMLLQVKECWRPPEATRGHSLLPQSHLRAQCQAHALDIGLPASRPSVKEFQLRSCSICGSLVGSSRKFSTGSYSFGVLLDPRSPASLVLQTTLCLPALL